MDVNDNEPVFLPYNSAVSVEENAPPQVLAELTATDQDEGLFGQVSLVNFYLLKFSENISTKQLGV